MKKTSETNLENIRHSLAHLLAAAVMELWPTTKRAIGPAIDDGFYFDFEFKKPISEADLPKIEKKMLEILPKWNKFSKHLLTANAAKKEYPGNPYKHELIQEFSKGGKKVSFYKSGDYWDLCRGGHVKNMREIKPDSFKLHRLAGAYWRGDEKNPMLQRIYGLAFETKQELEAHLHMLEEAKKRDHKKLGAELDLFTFSELVGAGLPLWTPKGTAIRQKLDDFVWSLRQKYGYERVEIPHIAKKDLYEKSGHWDKFKDEMFKIETREGHLFAMKPMNCPHHTQIYKRKLWSYRELPQRYANTTMVYRDEQTGELSGLSRVRSITQDDAHVFCRSSQIKEEMFAIWNIIEEFYNAVGFNLEVRLSFHDPKQPKKYLGTPKIWKEAESKLRTLVKERKVNAVEAIGEAAFYGPKIDFMAKDSLGRKWQVATIQLDMNLPERFDLSAINEKGKPERIVMIHAAIMGSIERYMSILIEHFGGAFPLWLAPTQIIILPISEKVETYAKEIEIALRAEKFQVELGNVNETLGKRIREAELKKIPYIIIVGEKEEQNKTLSTRHFKRGQENEIKIDQLIKKVKEEIENKII